jgi:surface polysaccharide O-acyltransferase-like enzyme
VVAIFQVILIHLSFPVIGKVELPASYQLAAGFYNALSRAGVPIFFMISGYLLLGREESIVDFLRKRFLKVGVPTLVWTGVYLLWHQEAYRDGSMHILHIGLSMFKAIFGGHIEIHLWFIYVLLGLYLIVPILRVLVSASPDILKYFLFLWLVANPLFSLLGRISGETVDQSLRLLLVEGYAGYMILGYVLGQWSLSVRDRLFVAAIFVVSVFAIFEGTNYLTAQSGSFEGFLHDYLGFPVIIMSASLFLFFKSLEKSFTGRNIPFFRQLADATFGIYLVHVLIQEGLRKGWFGFRLYPWMGPSAYMIPLTGLAVFVFSFIVVFAIKRLPVFKYAV